jgi:glycosyltransferase involved in cell wall biosynthesis
VKRGEVPAYLSAADICVAPEPSNPLNDRSTVIKIMEYMAMGKPTVAFDLPEHRFTAGNAAVYARPNDELDYARQIATLMDHPERRARMGQAGRERVEAELAWPHQAGPLLKAYQAALAQRVA